MIGRRAVIGAIGAAGVAGAALAQTSGFDGSWTGTLAIPGGGGLRLRLVIKADGTAELYSLDQGGAMIPGRVTARTAEAITAEWPAISGKYEGRLAGDAIEGTFTQGGPLPLKFLRGEAGAAASAPPPSAEVLTDAGIEKIRADANLPALAAFAAHAQKGRKDWATGERAFGSGKRVTKDDRWHLGSNTKSMTATLIGRLVDQGKLRWTDTVGGLLGATVPNLRAEYRDLNFLHLLSHRSGMQGNIPMEELLKFSQSAPDLRQERLRYATLALAMEPKGPKETTFEYSNNGYVVAGAMIEAKLGESWETLIRRELFEPLGMTSAGFGAPDVNDDLSQPCGHGGVPDGQPIPVRKSMGVTDNPAALGPAGTVHASLADFTRYLEAHRDRSSLLKAQTWAILHTPPFGGDYALGWVVVGDGARWHNGSNTMWYAEGRFDRSTGVAVAAATNTGVVTTASPAVRLTLNSAELAVTA